MVKKHEELKGERVSDHWGVSGIGKAARPAFRR